ncbi:MAG: pilin [Candidatus Moranbacteria bacterium]|nr:pilin [Candidatus Moranbacteria bacterium]
MKFSKKNKIYIKIFFSAIILFFAASSAHAALVPCGIGEGNADCTLCHLVVGFKNIYDYLLTLLLSAATVVIIVAGVIYMISSGNKNLIDKAKSAFMYTITAIVLGLTAWLMINTVLNALGFKNAGSWWTFTCDTTQTSVNNNLNTGIKLPGLSGGASTGSQTNKAQGDGTCGGIKDNVEDPNNCGKTSQALDTLLACIQSRMNATGIEVKKNFNPFKIEEVFASGKLSISIGIDENSHANNSCHYGGRYCQGQANAADLHGDMPAIKDAAIACNADTVIYDSMAYYGGKSKAYTGGNNKTGDWAHVKHVHVSVNNKACGCDYLK